MYNVMLVLAFTLRAVYAAPCGAVLRRLSADRSCFAAPYGAQCECHFTGEGMLKIYGIREFCCNAHECTVASSILDNLY